MDGKKNLRKKIDENTYLKIEEELGYRLNPVQPDPEFVRRLQHRLTHPPQIQVEDRSSQFLYISLFGGFLAGIIILLALNRIRWKRR